MTAKIQNVTFEDEDVAHCLTKDWGRLRTIVAPTLLVGLGLCSFLIAIRLMVETDRLSYCNG
ncbi:MAG: hypothetical protein Q9217_003930 [Psora testacea]